MNRIAAVLLSLVVFQAPRAVAQTTAPAAHEKSATTARLLGIVPGVGHMYAGEPGHGIAYLAGTVGLFVLSSGVAVTKCLDDELATNTCGNDRSSNVIAFAGLGLWGWSIYDAGRAAHRTNARRARQMSLFVAPGRSLSRGATPARTVRIGFRLGL